MPVLDLTAGWAQYSNDNQQKSEKIHLAIFKAGLTGKFGLEMAAGTA